MANNEEPQEVLKEADEYIAKLETAEENKKKKYQPLDNTGKHLPYVFSLSKRESTASGT